MLTFHESVVFSNQTKCHQRRVFSVFSSQRVNKLGWVAAVGADGAERVGGTRQSASLAIQPQPETCDIFFAISFFSGGPAY